jgi:hypothetical protein
MIPADQEFAHRPEDGVQGDCTRACIASLLELPVGEVPHFAQEAVDAHGLEQFVPFYYDAIEEWLNERGYRVTWGHNPSLYPDGTHCIVSGPSVRRQGAYHACVGIVENGVPRVVHDPHPSRSGFAAGSRLTCSFIVSERV